MFWTIVIIAILVCICVSIGASSEDSAAAAKKALAQDKEHKDRTLARLEQDRAAQIEARRPDAMTAMLKEEFPAFAGDFTYARSKALLDWYDTRGSAAETRARASAPAQASELLGMLFARECALLISPAFVDHATNNTSATWMKFVLCARTSTTRAQGM